MAIDGEDFGEDSLESTAAFVYIEAEEPLDCYGGRLPYQPLPLPPLKDIPARAGVGPLDELSRATRENIRLQRENRALREKYLSIKAEHEKAVAKLQEIKGLVREALAQTERTAQRTKAATNFRYRRHAANPAKPSVEKG